MKLSDQLALVYIRSIKQFRLITIKMLTSVLFTKRDSYQRILINRDGAFGDSIVALPAISIIRQNYPGAKIDLLSVSNGGVTFEDLGLADNLINTLFVINKKQRVETLKKLRANNYDLFIQIPQNLGLYKSIRNILLVRFCLNIKSGFGWDSGRIKVFRHLQKRFLDIPTERHRFIKTLNENGLTGKIEYPIREKIPDDRSLNSLVSTNKLLAFLIGGKLPSKKWPLDHWVSLAHLIEDQYKILIIGGYDENNDAEYIKSKTANTINLCGKLSIPELFYVLKKIKLAVSLDTGAMHLCDAAETKMVVLFSNHDLSNKWFPNYKNAIVMENNSSAAHDLISDNPKNTSMENISPDEVFSNMSLLLNNEN